jgi:hypothetical protein
MNLTLENNKYFTKNVFTSMSNKFLLLILVFILSVFELNAQDLTEKQKDKIFLKRPFYDWYIKNTKSFKKLYDKTFINKDLHLTSSLLLSRQDINNANFKSKFLYDFNAINTNAFRPGYNVGFRIENKKIADQKFTYGVAFNKFYTGNVYSSSFNLPPFLSSFSNYKAEENFSTLNFFLYKKVLINISDTTKYRFHLTFGPSFHYVVSKTSLDNNIKNGYSPNSFVNGDLGLEFNNKGYYVIFMHYRYGANIINQQVPINLNSFEIGMMLKAKDIF